MAQEAAEKREEIVSTTKIEDSESSTSASASTPTTTTSTTTTTSDGTTTEGSEEEDNAEKGKEEEDSKREKEEEVLRQKEQRERLVRMGLDREEEALRKSPREKVKRLGKTLSFRTRRNRSATCPPGGSTSAGNSPRVTTLRTMGDKSFLCVFLEDTSMATIPMDIDKPLTTLQLIEALCKKRPYLNERHDLSSWGLFEYVDNVRKRQLNDTDNICAVVKPWGKSERDRRLVFESIQKKGAPLPPPKRKDAREPSASFPGVRFHDES